MILSKDEKDCIDSKFNDECGFPWKNTGQIPIDWFNEQKDCFFLELPEIALKKTSVCNLLENKWHCIYFLFQENCLVYVGKTNIVSRRIAEHQKAATKQFTHIAIIEVPAMFVNDLERHYIKKFMPTYNASMH